MLVKEKKVIQMENFKQVVGGGVDILDSYGNKAPLNVEITLRPHQKQSLSE